MSYDMGQSEFAELAGIGRASLSRWESGQHIQNRSSDNLLFLLSFRENMTKLRRRAAAQAEPGNAAAHQLSDPKRRFRQLNNADLEILKIEADCFDPFPAHLEAAQCM
jgi:transcriptional regulator with XRE-family HTH domain